MGKEKKEIGKLLELLNEYEDTDNWENGYQVEFRESKIISKKFGFIKWLVENDKIERNEKFYLEDDEGLFGTYECLLMQLAIQENPICFLCSLLK